ncbi:hypothetical protein AOLI_G00094530 [Acnodon oligacanthus]
MAYGGLTLRHFWVATSRLAPSHPNRESEADRWPGASLVFTRLNCLQKTHRGQRVYPGEHEQLDEDRLPTEADAELHRTSRGFVSVSFDFVDTGEGAPSSRRRLAVPLRGGASCPRGGGG